MEVIVDDINKVCRVKPKELLGFTLDGFTIMDIRNNMVEVDSIPASLDVQHLLSHTQSFIT